MFSDLVGSTALSARMDPEDLREVISAYQKCVAETVQRFGGFVAKFMGDGVLIYFGYPQAHEDDAERAVRAGLELVAAVGALKTHTPLQTRVGIATGLVVVGDLIGSGASQEQAIGGNEDQAIGALLHDAAEDLVMPWPRSSPIARMHGQSRRGYLAKLPTKPTQSLLVSLADKTHNVEAILFDYRVLGELLWQRFNDGAEGTRWYYGALADGVFPNNARTRLSRAVAAFSI